MKVQNALLARLARYFTQFSSHTLEMNWTELMATGEMDDEQPQGNVVKGVGLRASQRLLVLSSFNSHLSMSCPWM
jgi:hypothetical protein